MFAIALAREIGRGPGKPIPVSDAVAVALLVGLEAVAVWLVFRIWRDRERAFAAKVFWAAVTLVPVVGLRASGDSWTPANGRLRVPDGSHHRRRRGSAEEEARGQVACL